MNTSTFMPSIGVCATERYGPTRVRARAAAPPPSSTAPVPAAAFSSSPRVTPSPLSSPSGVGFSLSLIWRWFLSLSLGYPLELRDGVARECRHVHVLAIGADDDRARPAHRLGVDAVEPRVDQAAGLARLLQQARRR